MLARKEIPFFNYGALFQEIEAEVMAAVRNVFSRGAYIMQSDLAEFETSLARYLGVNHVIGVADGTMGLLLPLLACELRPGDEVILPSHTFIASAAAIHHAGGIPVPVDCGRDHLIDPESVGAAITGRTRGIMPVQLNGRTADMGRLQKLASEHGLFIVEDSCQALGSKYNGRFAGTFGIAGALSFYPSKTLGCFGDGGAVICNDDKMAEAIKVLRDHGRGSDGKVAKWGYNSRLDNVQAAILNIKLAHYDRYVERRRVLAALYDQRLRDIKELLLPPPPNSDPAHFDVFQNYEVEAERRDALRYFLDSRGIKTIIQWGGHTIHQFEALGFSKVPPYTDSMTSRYLLFPLNTAISDDDVDYICDAVREFYRK